jgi:NAD(P)-dependent dehydrogenase (short-subunit alcohol dehydrogenase family)
MHYEGRINMNRHLENTLSVVTGGSQGLGKAITEALACAGSTVVIGDIKAEQAAQAAEQFTRQGLRVVGHVLNVADETSVAAFIDWVEAEYGRLDVLVNNAGTDVTKAVEELTVAEWDRVLAVNLRGPFLMAKAALHLMARQQSGQIINIVSTAAKRAWPNASAYHASKWGLLGLSHALFTEARPFGVKVTAVLPGGMRTAFILDRFPDVDPNNLQDPRAVAETILYVLSLPPETVIPEIMVLPLRETSWP